MADPILVIGRSGQLARALQGILPKEKAVFWDRTALDLSSSKDNISKALNQCESISGIIIAAAYTAVDQAETDMDSAFAINATAPGVIAEFCKTQNVPLIYVSTDYVFQGIASIPYTTDSQTDPINAYGASKYAGEKAIQESGANAAILRTSWVFDGIGKNFLTTMLRLGSEREHISIVADQVGRPTYAGHLAVSCLKAFDGLKSKTLSPEIYHVTGSGDPCSWAEFAEEIFNRTADLRPHNVNVNAIPSSDYPTLAARPHYSVLDVSKFEKAVGTHLPDWGSGLDKALAEYYSILA